MAPRWRMFSSALARAAGRPSSAPAGCRAPGTSRAGTILGARQCPARASRSRVPSICECMAAGSRVGKPKISPTISPPSAAKAPASSPPSCWTGISISLGVGMLSMPHTACWICSAAIISAMAASSRISIRPLDVSNCRFASNRRFEAKRRLLQAPFHGRMVSLNMVSRSRKARLRVTPIPGP